MTASSFVPAPSLWLSHHTGAQRHKRRCERVCPPDASARLLAGWQPTPLHHSSQTHPRPAVSCSDDGFQLRTRTEPVGVTSHRSARRHERCCERFCPPDASARLLAGWQPTPLHHSSQTHPRPAVSCSDDSFQLRTRTEPVAVASHRRATPRAPLRARLSARRIGAPTRWMAAYTSPPFLSNSPSPRGELFR